MDNITYLRKMVDSIVEVWAAHPNVKAVASVGSVALGDVDHISDTDTICYVDTLPPEEEVIKLRDAVMHEWGNWYWKSEEFGYGMYFFVNGVKCDIGLHPIDQWEELMDDVLNDYDLDAGKQKAMSGIVNAAPLYGDDLVNKWKNRARNEYPDELAEKLVTEYMKFRPLWILSDMAAGRNDLVWFYDELVKMQHNVLGTLVGLNRMYHPMDYKHLDFITNSMTHKPDNLANRLREALLADPQAGTEMTAQLVEETLTLVGEHIPQFDVEAKRTWLRTPPMTWEQVVE